MLKFVLMERFLGLWDMISDVLMADLIGNCRLLQDSQCSFEPNDDAPEYTPTDERRAVRERFFWVSVFFLFFNATVLWVAICQHFLHPACADFMNVIFGPLGSKVIKYEETGGRFRHFARPGWIFLLFLFLCGIALPSTLFGVLLWVVVALPWHYVQRALHHCLPLLVGRPSDLFLSSDDVFHVYSRGARVTVALFAAAALPIGIVFHYCCLLYTSPSPRD